MEFLREGEKEEDKQAEPEKPKQQAKDEAKPKNAWILQKPGHSSIIIVQMLAFIGKFFALLLPGFKSFFFQRKGLCPSLYCWCFSSTLDSLEPFILISFVNV